MGETPEIFLLPCNLLRYTIVFTADLEVVIKVDLKGSLTQSACLGIASAWVVHP